MAKIKEKRRQMRGPKEPTIVPKEEWKKAFPNWDRIVQWEKPVKKKEE